MGSLVPVSVAVLGGPRSGFRDVGPARADRMRAQPEGLASRSLLVDLLLNANHKSKPETTPGTKRFAMVLHLL